MKKVLVSIKNGLLSEAIIRALKNCGEFVPYPITPGFQANDADCCETADADIWLMEVSYHPGTTMGTRLEEIRQVRRCNPECKVAVLCDDNAAPDLAHKVMQMKKDHMIDTFLYTSVTENYLMSTLATL